MEMSDTDCQFSQRPPSLVGDGDAELREFLLDRGMVQETRSLCRGPAFANILGVPADVDMNMCIRCGYVNVLVAISD